MKRLMISAVFLLPLVACSTLLTKSDEDVLKKREAAVYILKKDVEIKGKKLNKGDEVRIVIATSKNWVKVYAYPVRFDPLKAERYLILYVFEDEFMNKKFDINAFDARLAEVASVKSVVRTQEKKVIKKK